MKFPYAALEWSMCWSSEQDVELREVVGMRCTSREEKIGRELLVVKGAVVRSQAAQRPRVLCGLLAPDATNTKPPETCLRRETYHFAET